MSFGNIFNVSNPNAVILSTQGVERYSKTTKASEHLTTLNPNVQRGETCLTLGEHRNVPNA